MTYLSTFGPEFENNILIFEIRKRKKNRLNLVSKMSYLGILGLEFQKTFVIFEINPSNLGPKMLYLGIFCQKCLIWVFFG